MFKVVPSIKHPNIQNRLPPNIKSIELIKREDGAVIVNREDLQGEKQQLIAFNSQILYALRRRFLLYWVVEFGGPLLIAGGALASLVLQVRAI